MIFNSTIPIPIALGPGRPWVCIGFIIALTYGCPHQAIAAPAKPSSSSAPAVHEVSGQVVALFQESIPKGRAAMVSKYAVTLRLCPPSGNLATYSFPSGIKENVDEVFPYLLRTASPSVSSRADAAVLDSLNTVSLWITAAGVIRKWTLWGPGIGCDKQALPSPASPALAPLRPENNNPIPGSPIVPGLDMRKFHLEHE